MPCGSPAPFGTLLHVPSDADSAHDWQAPLQAESQQTPCAQNVETHSLPSKQVLPKPFRPQEPLMHTAGSAQSASAVQAALQTPPPHWKGKHELAGGVTQAPSPSQVEPAVNSVVPPGQVDDMQAVPFG
jgi:hypothetical protein